MAEWKYIPLQIVAAIVLLCELTSAFPFWWNVRPLGLPFCPRSASSDNICYDIQLTERNCTTVVRDVCPQHGHGHKRSIVIYKELLSYGPCYSRSTRTCVNYRCIQKCCKGFQRDSAGKCSLPVGMDVPECRNGGTPLGTKCMCPRHYEGDRCETAICDKECLNGGYCHGNITMEAPKCVCTSNFTGDQCQSPVCGDGCMNNGTCILDKMHAKCLCPHGYYGDRCQNKTNIEKCPTIPKHFNTACTDRCSENSPCGEGEFCCEFEGEKICMVEKKFQRQTCSFRDAFNRRMFVRVGETYFDYFDYFCRCRPNPYNRFGGGVKDCSVMHCNPQNSQCADETPEDETFTGLESYRKPIITNCPEKGVPLYAIVSQFSNKAAFSFKFDARDGRGKKLSTHIQKRIFIARNTTQDDIFHNKVTSSPDERNHTAECCFDVKVLDHTPPRFLSCPADITAFSGEVISWIKPTAVDNVGIHRFIEPNLSNGTIISSGFYVFTYTAEDWSGNAAHCSFSVQVTDWNSDSNGWSESLRSRLEPNTAVIIGGAVVGILSIVLIILTLFVVRSCRVRSRTRRDLVRRRMQRASSNQQRQMSISSIYSNEPPPYDIAAKDKLPEYTPRDDPPVYMEKEGVYYEKKSMKGCDNPTYSI